MRVEPRLSPSFAKFKSRRTYQNSETPTEITVVDDVALTPIKIHSKKLLTAWSDHDAQITTSTGDIKPYADDRIMYDSDVRLWLQVDGRLVEMTSNNFVEPHNMTPVLFNAASGNEANIFQMEAAMGYYKELEVSYDDEATTTGDLFRVVNSGGEFYIEALDGADIFDVLPAEVGDVIAIEVDEDAQGDPVYQYAKISELWGDEGTTTDEEFTSTMLGETAYVLETITEYSTDAIESNEYNNAIVAKDYHAGGRNIYIDALIIRNNNDGVQGRFNIDSVSNLNKEVMRTLRIYNRQHNI